MNIYDFLSTRTGSLFERTESFLRDLIPGCINVHVVPVLESYKSHVESSPESERLSAEKFLDNESDFNKEAFIGFKCYWKMVSLMEEWVKI